MLGIQILSAGVTLPSRIILKGSMVKSLAVLLAPVMLFAVLVGGALAKAYATLVPHLCTLQWTRLMKCRAFPEIRWTECFVISACLAYAAYLACPCLSADLLAIARPTLSLLPRSSKVFLPK